MDFNLSPEHLLIRKMMAEFTENEVKPIAAETDAKTLYPRENIEKLFDLGVMGMCIPKEYGGQGADPLASAICIEELSKQCASTGDIVATHNGLCCDPIMTHGTEAQKAKYLPMLTTGHKVGAFALTEPNAGSDASKGQTEAKLEGDHYVMNGSKIFITNGYVADVFVVFAMTDKSKGTKGISAFIVESSFPGFSVGKHEEKLGLHGSPTAEIVFTDMIVPKENLLGKEGQGFKICMQTLDVGRIGIAAQALGIAEGAMEQAVEYTKGRVQFGKPISKFQNTQFTFADMELGCEAGRLLTYQAAIKKGAGERYTKEAAMAKLFAADAASDAAIRIGISPWGFEGEFAVREALEQRYHLLLGGGPGAAFAGEVNAQAPGLIWSRADKDGRSVMAIDIMALPEPGVPFAWEWGLSMQAQEVRLTSAVPSDPHMEALVAGKAAR